MKTQKSKKKKINVILITLWCIWLCILTFVILNNTTQSRYVSQVETSGSTIEVAKPIAILSNTTLGEANNNPLKKEISFAVQNYNEEGSSEVAMSYYLSIIKKEGLPVTYLLYQLYDENKELVAITNGTTSNNTLPHTTNTKHNYVLELTFSEPPSNQDIENAVSIELHAEQIQ